MIFIVVYNIVQSIYRKICYRNMLYEFSYFLPVNSINFARAKKICCIIFIST